MMFYPAVFALYFGTFVCATPIIWDGRAPYSYSPEDVNQSSGPFSSVVKGKHKASYYFRILQENWRDRTATPIWTESEQRIGIYIDKTSIFIPADGVPQQGFRRSELIAKSPEGGDQTAFDGTIANGITAFHFSVLADKKRPLNYTHEYKAVWIEKPDGSSVFDLATGTPLGTAFSNDIATELRIRAHDGTVLFHTPTQENKWHNFAVLIDWNKLTLKVYFSLDADPLKVVTDVHDNASAGSGSQGRGDYHFGVLKLPMIDPSDTPADQSDIVHHGIQEHLHEQIYYSGVFIEDVGDGISVGHGETMPVSD